VSFEELRSLSDEDLFVHLAHEDADAVALLYQRYRRLVFAVAFQVLRDQGEAEDVVQNVFVDLYKINLRYDPAAENATTGRQEITCATPGGEFRPVDAARSFRTDFSLLRAGNGVTRERWTGLVNEFRRGYRTPLSMQRKSLINPTRIEQTFL
jgi:hypothetical protein